LTSHDRLAVFNTRERAAPRDQMRMDEQTISTSLRHRCDKPYTQLSLYP
jgi:hypothetical protein